VKFEPLSREQGYDATAHIWYVPWSFSPGGCIYTVSFSEEIKRASYAGKIGARIVFPF
jgi:hypothetical protein